MIDRRRFLAGSSLLLGASTLGLGRALAAAAPGRVLFGYSAGALGSDLGISLCGLLAANGGPRYQLENVEGSTTRKSAEVVKAAAPDGMTLLQAQSTTMCLLPSIFNKMTFDPLKDFTPLVTTGKMSLSLTLGPLVPGSVQTLAQYLDWLSDNPDARDVGFSVYGSEGHLATLILAQAKGVTVTPRPYKGSKMMLDDMLGKTLAACFTAASNGGNKTWNDNGKGGGTARLRSIGITTAQRLSYWPEVPTLAEQGVKDMDLSPWFGWYAPATTPASVADSIRASLLATQNTAAYTALLERLRLSPLNETPEQIRQRIKNDTARYTELVTKYGPARID
jgi:tripartite-type tricarboxylate transporter receptor subunit TctC